MAYDSTNKKLYKTDTQGISTSEIAVCLGDYRVTARGRDIGLLCSSPKINKWAFHKPVRHSTTGVITDEEIISTKCGLSPVSVSKLLSMGIGADTLGSHTEDECRGEISEWEYLRPRGLAYSERLRTLDFDGYTHKAVAPDSGWSQKSIDDTVLDRMKAVDVTMSATGVYAGYNFKMTPLYNSSEYNGGLYSSFAMRFGSGSGESVGDITNMDIPIAHVASLDGCWRVALAVWIPSFGSAGGWGFFASRMTVGQYFSEGLGSGTNLQQLFPDLATNPYVAGLMDSYVSANGGYATFNAVPLLVKDLGSTYINGVFSLRPVSGVTEAYCMPSGTGAIPLICGTPPMTLYYKISYGLVGSAMAAYITNTDTAASHTFGYEVTNITPDGTTTSTATVTLSAEEQRQVGGAPSQAGYSVTVKVTSQDGVEL